MESVVGGRGEAAKTDKVDDEQLLANVDIDETQEAWVTTISKAAPATTRSRAVKATMKSKAAQAMTNFTVVKATTSSGRLRR